MREATGALNTFRIAIIFTLLFAVFISLAISYNKVIKIKNESLSIIELNEGIRPNTLDILNNYLRNSGYRARSTCNSDEYGVANLNSNDLEQGGNGGRYFYCLRPGEVTDSTGTTKVFYNLKLFYNFEIPLFGGVNLMVFNINGETRRITKYTDLDYTI